jgi:Fe-S-cluster-containing hydrogenase component 2/DNA-binding Lrp family transcriptional regulator
MTEKIYQKLAKHLDNLPGGFPPSDTGVEIRILKRLFTPEEAEFALHLTLIPEQSSVVARRANVSTREASQRLETMAQKGLIYRIDADGDPPMYMAAQYAIGIWEFQVRDLDEGLAKDMGEYMPLLFEEAWKKPQLRTIPVNKSLSGELKVMTYEDAEAMVKNIKKAVVAPCICRRERGLVGKGCDKPQETCLIFDTAAAYYQRNGLGREIDRQEVLDILKRAEQAGLVLQPTNAKEIINICCCCGDCCGVLRNLSAYPKPASLVASSFFAVVNTETCEGCRVCEDRCQMAAVHHVGGKASIDRDRCIGCGLCVSTCPTESMTLARKPESDQPDVPKDLTRAFLELGRARGKLSWGDLIMMQIKSKVDRLLASK